MTIETAADHTRVLHLDASPGAVFDALTTAAGVTGWWTPITGSGLEGGELLMTFGGDGTMVIDVARAERPSAHDLRR